MRGEEVRMKIRLEEGWFQCQVVGDETLMVDLPWWLGLIFLQSWP